jgi:hypothetical protein
VGAIAMAGGAAAIGSGISKRSEMKAHSDSIRQKLSSFSGEVAPVNVEVEGNVVEVRGNAEERFRQWRNFLREYYEHETGAAGTVGTVAASGTSRL